MAKLAAGMQKVRSMVQLQGSEGSSEGSSD
jgi:hypothetical protein